MTKQTRAPFRASSSKWNHSHHKNKQQDSPLIPITTPTTITTLVSVAVVAILALAAAGAQAQSVIICDAPRLLRCQADVQRDLSTYQGSYGSLSGPPYSPGASLRAPGNSASLCRSVRANLDCLLRETPPCYDMEPSARQTDLIRRAKAYLDDYGNLCNSLDFNWRSVGCFRAPELKACEQRYAWQYDSLDSSMQNNNMTLACAHYNSFRDCVEQHARMNCKVSEMDLTNEYLIDKVVDYAWRCPANLTASSLIVRNSNPLTGRFGGLLASGSPDYVQRPLAPTYGTPDRLRDSNSLAWESFQTPERINEQFGRLVLGDAGSDCAIKISPYIRDCESKLLMAQSFSSQPSNIEDTSQFRGRQCCAFRSFRDCLTNQVISRCVDPSMSAVDILMGIRRREHDFYCNDQAIVCSSAQSSLHLTNLLGALALASAICTAQWLAQTRSRCTVLA